MTDRLNNRSGSALIMVLGVISLLALLITGFGYELRADLKASSSSYEQALNLQLARSALALAELEVGRENASLYADSYGNACFVLDEDSYEAEIEELMLYRSGMDVGRGRMAYRLIVKLNALDIAELTEAEWGRLFEVSCGLDEGDERDALVDAILDWTDSDDIARELGAEEEFYQALEPPRYPRNAAFETIEELLLVEGMTPELLYGASIPLSVDDGMLMGGGLYRFLVGDNSDEAEASIRYIRTGIVPSEDEEDEEAESVDPDEFEKLDDRPETLYLLAEGFVPVAGELDAGFDDEGAPPAENAYQSRHIILAKLALPEQGDSTEYSVEDFQENAAGELLLQVLAYGVPEEETYEP